MDLVQPTITKAAPKLGRVYPQWLTDLVEGNYQSYLTGNHKRDDQESIFDNKESADAFVKALKSYSDNRPAGPISIRVRQSGNSVVWYAKDREVRTKKETDKPADETGNKPTAKQGAKTGVMPATKK